MDNPVRYKNWPAINALSNHHLKSFVTFSDDPDALERIYRGWPELFSEVPTPVQVSAHVLEIDSGGGGSDEDAWHASASWLSAAKKAGVPIAISCKLDRLPQLQAAIKRAGPPSCGDQVQCQDRAYIIVHLGRRKIALVEAQHIVLDRPYQDIDPTDPTS